LFLDNCNFEEELNEKDLCGFRGFFGYQFFGVCQRKSGLWGGGAAAGSGTGPIIGIAMPETHVERWVKDGASLVRFAQAKGYRTIDTYGDGNQVLQNQQMQNMITSGVKLIVAAVVNDGANSIIAEAAREGIPVISYDRIIANSPDYDYYVTFDSHKVGEFQAQSLITALNLDAATPANPKLITLFAGSPTDKNAFWFFDGAMKVLNPYVDKGVLKIIGPYPKNSDDSTNFQRISTENWQAPVAKTRMENLLSGDAKSVVLDGVLAPNDTLARAIIEALRADAKYTNKLPIVTGQDAEADSIVSIKSGRQYMTVFKDTTKLAEAVILLADQILKRQPLNIPGARRAEGELAYMANNGVKTVQTFILEPQIITKDNWDIPLKAGFYTPAEEAKLK
jgi:putative multiple sugar transport system substrate-binding protein